MPALSAVLLICSFQFSLRFFNISLARPHQHCGVLLFLIRNIGHWTLPKMWVGTFLVQNLQPRGKTKLILTVKMETIHPVEEPFGSEFPATCNHCGVMTADGLKSKDLEFLCAISRFFWKNDPSQTFATPRIAPKICQGQPLPLAHTVPDFIQICSLSAELLPNA